PIRYFTVTASSTPITPDAIPIPPQSASLGRPTKIILPKGKPQKWSTGTTAGDLGGPPTGTTTAKWGLWNEDPVTAEGFIWNKEFKGRFERLLRREEIDAGLATDEEDSAGFLNFDRVMNLNRVLVPKYGLMHLELIPMLVGFFTCKIATFIQAIDDAISVAEDKPDS
ncbi:CONSERVED ONLY IN THE GREEN LINEAGE 160, chloroplastic-like protein, partial [Drosera capensis]